jgi:hypothetical protein
MYSSPSNSTFLCDIPTNNDPIILFRICTNRHAAFVSQVIASSLILAYVTVLCMLFFGSNEFHFAGSSANSRRIQCLSSVDLFTSSSQ